METIFKYHISPGQKFIDSYEGANIISAGIDPEGDLCVWAIVNPENEPEKINILCIGTGWELPIANKSFRFVGTVKHEIYMWHIFQEYKW